MSGPLGAAEAADSPLPALLAQIRGRGAGRDGVSKPWTRRDRDMFCLGVKCAAGFAGEWDRQINHPYRFEDVILYKFNLRKRKPRKKVKR